MLSLYKNAVYQKKSSKMNDNVDLGILYDIAPKSLGELSKRIPDAIIAGFAKCGTGTMHYFLEQHPEISIAEGEVHYYNYNFLYNKGIDWYQDRMNVAYKSQLVLETTAAYTINNATPERIFNVNPKTKFIILMRNPVHRAISHYKMMNFMDLYVKNINNADTFFDKNVNLSSYTPYNQRFYTDGLYINHLSNVLHYFNRSQILLINSENFVKYPWKTLKRVENFLKIKPYFNKNKFVFSAPKRFYCICKNSYTYFKKDLRKVTCDNPMIQEEVSCMSSRKGFRKIVINSTTINNLYKYYAKTNLQLEKKNPVCLIITGLLYSYYHSNRKLIVENSGKKSSLWVTPEFLTAFENFTIINGCRLSLTLNSNTSL
ncbi:Heparan sulfate 3-O-sulfotransferase 1 [Intoshia linei]|uniref:Heparan sulfate 3-O-sulfotransferase 1 n=1 Tax=Intoshia linei TaxID=1819745 RepID=A0A177AR08_9BILA|nr:Heparan sulfate 3-O-sulfotransferase 1 [Intoshia linei]